MKFIETSDCEVLIRIWKLKIYYRASTPEYGPRVLGASWRRDEEWLLPKTLFYFGGKKQVKP